MDETNQGFMKHNGGLSLKKINNTMYEFEVEVRDIHLNTGKIAHGGFLSTIADTGMGTAAHQAAGNKRCVTISLDIKFISAALLGEVLTGKVVILRKTRTLVFVSCEIINQKNILSPTDFEIKVNELKSEIKKYNDERNNIINNYNKIKIDNTKKLIDLINPILTNYSNDQSIDMILQKKNLIVGKNELDITEKIIALVNNDIKEFKVK